MPRKENMTLRGRFHDSFFSCFSSSPASPPSPPPLPSPPRPSASPLPEEQKKKKQDEDSYREANIPAPSDPELTRWLRATQAAQLRSHRPTKADVPSPWAYANETEQVCTLEPFTCERVTLFLRSTLSGPDMARKLYDDFFSAMEVTFKEISEGDAESSYPVDPTITHIINEDGHPILMVETAPGEHMYGSTLMLTSNTVESLEALEYLDSIFPVGYSCLISHDALAVTMETVVGTMRLICRSGIESTQLSAKHMATIFEVEADGAPKVHSGRHLGIAPKVVARCVLGYRDASVWQSVGPTIQTLMIRTDYQGNGLIQELFNAVEKWFMDTWTLDTRYSNRALKATHLRDFIVDRAPRKQDDPVDSYNELTDKMFFYEMMHFECNNPYPADPRVKLQDDLPEAHAIRFYPPTGTSTHLPTVLYSKPYLIKGWRSCDYCRLSEEVPGRLEVCSNCNSADYYWRAHYCNRACQVKDWAVHRLWCGKTFDQFMDARKTFEESRRNVGASTPNQVDSRDDSDEPQNRPT